MNFHHFNIDVQEDINGLRWISQDIYVDCNVKFIDKQNGHSKIEDPGLELAAWFVHGLKLTGNELIHRVDRVKSSRL